MTGKENTTNPPGGALHTVRAMGREVTKKQNAKARTQSTRMRLLQQQGGEAKTLASHRDSDD